MSQTDKSNIEEVKFTPPSRNGFWKGFCVAAVLVLLPAIYTIQKQQEFIARQNKFIGECTAIQSPVRSGKPEMNTTPQTFPSYDPLLDEQELVKTNESEGTAILHLHIKAGTEFQVSQDSVARVYGPDKCPIQNGGDGCIRLIGRASADVRLIYPDGTDLSETWTISDGYDQGDGAIRLARPNGWLLSEPNPN